MSSLEATGSLILFAFFPQNDLMVVFWWCLCAPVQSERSLAEAAAPRLVVDAMETVGLGTLKATAWK